MRGMDVMQFRLFALFLGATLFAACPAAAQLKDRVLIPAPIPDYGAVAVPGVVPVPEGFTYYLRADLGWGFVTSRNYTENGVIYGAGTPPFASSTPFGFGGVSMGEAGGDGVFLGTVGYGAYFTPRFRGDLTIDFRSSLDLQAQGAYSYLTAGGGSIINGSVTDRVKINNAVALANLYWDLLPRGFFTPYIGAGIGLAYYDATRTYIDFAVPLAGVTMSPQTTTFSSKDTGVTLAGALMAGATFAIDQHWLIDINYRALYLGEVEVVTNVTGLPFNSSRVTIGDTWEQQARIGLRYNIW
jgi:opacity protein-like surface antigen